MTAPNPSKLEQNKPAAGRLRKWLHAWWRPMLAVLAGVVMVSGVVLLVWLVPPALYQHVSNEQVRVGAEASTRTGLIAGLAGLAALGGLVLTARNVQINRQTLDATQRAQNETLRLTEQGHITERYTKAIEQLGSAQLDVRLGGIYAPERIAVDSIRDHSTVVEVLSAFIREHSRPTTSRMLLPIERSRMQAAVSVLGRLPSRLGVSRGNLTDAQLTGAYLDGATLTRADLGEATLTGANLHGANLTGANLVMANLSGANLVMANLTMAKNLIQQQLGSAQGDDKTKPPAGLQRPTQWLATD